MHRMSLALPRSPLEWDRTLNECINFDETLNKQNVSQSTIFMRSLRKKAYEYGLAYFSDEIFMTKLLNSQLESEDKRVYRQAIHNVFEMIYRAPVESDIFKFALKNRAFYHFELGLYKEAAKDLHMFLYVGGAANRHPEEMVNIMARATICYYVLNDRTKAKEYLRMFHYYKNSVTNLFEDENSAYICRLVLSLNIPPQIDEPAKKMQNNVFIPYKGFHPDKQMGLVSRLLEYRSTDDDNRRSGMYALDDLPAKSLLLSEEPTHLTMRAPYLHCELCLQRSGALYTCLFCRLKTYCSIECMHKDWKFHELECKSYKIGLVHMLDAKDVLRLFVRVSTMLQKSVFTHGSYKKCTTAAQVLEHMAIREQQTWRKENVLRSIIIKQPDYNDLTDQHFSTMVMTAFRLTICLEYSRFLDIYFGAPKRLPNKEKMMLVGVILMRIIWHLYHSNLDVELKCYNNNIKQKVKNHMDLSGCLHSSVFANQEMESEVLHSLKEIQAMRQDNTYELFLGLIEFNPAVHPETIFLDKMLDYCLVRADDSIRYLRYFGHLPFSATWNEKTALSIAKLKHHERLLLVENMAAQFHYLYAKHFMKTYGGRYHQLQVVGIVCPIMDRFNHSCVPNMELIVLEDGKLFGKALKHIHPNEEICYKQKVHASEVSKKMKKNPNACVKCSSLECAGAKYVKKQNNGKSVQHLGKSFLLTFLKPDHDERRTLCQLLFVLRDCAKDNVVKDLVVKFQHMYKILLKGKYSECYAELLHIIRIFCDKNIKEGASGLILTDLKYIVSIGLDIVKTQKRYYKFYEAFDAHTSYFTLDRIELEICYDEVLQIEVLSRRDEFYWQKEFMRRKDLV